MPIASAQIASPGRKTASGDFSYVGSAHQAFSASKSKAALRKTPIATMNGVCAFPWEAYNYVGQNPVMRTDRTGLEVDFVDTYHDDSHRFGDFGWVAPDSWFFQYVRVPPGNGGGGGGDGLGCVKNGVFIKDCTRPDHGECWKQPSDPSDPDWTLEDEFTRCEQARGIAVDKCLPCGLVLDAGSGSVIVTPGGFGTNMDPAASPYQDWPGQPIFGCTQDDLIDCYAYISQAQKCKVKLVNDYSRCKSGL